MRVFTIYVCIKHIVAPVYAHTDQYNIYLVVVNKMA